MPTRELDPGREEFARLPRQGQDLQVAAVYGGSPLAATPCRRRPHIVVATPGRLEDLRSAAARARRIRILVLDEADRMLDMGFQPQVDAIVRRLSRKRRTMFFSATLDGEVRSCPLVPSTRAATAPSCRRTSRATRSITS